MDVRSALLALVIVTLPALPVGAQDVALPDNPAGPPPLTVSYADGRVDILRPGGVEPIQVPDLLQEDDRLVVGEGRVELVYDDGTLAHADRHTDLRVDLGVRLRLVRGRLIVHTAAAGESIEIATPAGIVRLDGDGEYDLAADDLDGDTAIDVVRGRAELQTETGVPVAAGDVLTIAPRDRRARVSRGGYGDAFRDWSERRAAPTTVGPISVSLPPAVQPWTSDLAVYGQWSTMAPYGGVWFPRVGPTWRPYAEGSWRYTRYGWTWIDDHRWGWPVHHYGRWGHHATRGWYWIPHRAWGPAWVGWAVEAEHVAWAPLGWNARPVVDFVAGVRLGPVGLWASTWSIVPRRTFLSSRGHGYGYGRSDYRDPGALPGPVLGGFVSQMIGPRGPAGADDRFAARPRSRPGPSSRAPRATSPVIAYQGRPTREAVPRETRPDASSRPVLDPPRSEYGRRRPTDARPVDAPPIDPAPRETGAARPRERVWSTAPESGSPPPERGPNRREERPVGGSGRPRAERPESQGGGERGSAAPARGSGGTSRPERRPEGAATPRRPEGSASPGTSGSGDGGRSRGGVRRPADGNGGARGDGAASGGQSRGQARRRG